MNPQRRKSITLRVAQAEKVSPDLLDQLAICYYSYVGDLLSSAKHARVDLPGLGVFSVKPIKLAAKIHKTRCMVEALDSAESMKKHALSREKRKELSTLQELLAQVDTERNRRNLIKKIRHESA